MIICIDGVNGVGKSTVIKQLQEKLPTVSFARLPGWSGSKTCQGIRDLLDSNDLDKFTRLHLFIADMNEFINKHDPSKVWIVDRSFISTFVYQTMEGIVSTDIHYALLPIIDKFDYLVLLHGDPKLLQARMDNRNTRTLKPYTNIDIETYQNEYFKWSEIYFSGRRLIVDTSKFDVDEICNQIIEFVRNKQ